VSDTFSGRAPAKINLSLDVLAKRADGYHEIDTVLQALELADKVTVSFGGEPGMHVSGPRAAGVPADETNGAWRAAAALATVLGRDISGLGIAIEKHIPAAGGLGGGSSDAATTLRLLQHAWPEATDAHLLDAALAVGSDEAFFLVGGTARARGRGERVEALDPLPRHGVVLFLPEVTLERKTARLFAALAETAFDSGDATTALVRRLDGAAVLTASVLHNAFERVSFDVFPGLRTLRHDIERGIGDPVRLSGAGPTLFWIGRLADVPSVAAYCQGIPCEVVITATDGP
jgi:4-diphosphocytidyl-2-C-methyl-D-erythritol kinase